MQKSVGANYHYYYRGTEAAEKNIGDMKAAAAAEKKTENKKK